MQQGEVTGHFGDTGPGPASTPAPSGGGAPIGDWILLAALVAAFAPALAAFSVIWDAVEYQAHGYLVGPVAAAMAWSRRDAMGERAPHPAGLALLLLALLMYGGGLLAGLLALQGVALPLALAGLVTFRHGVSGLRAMAFPIAYVLFLVPVPPAWLTPVVVGLQGFVSAFAIFVLRGLGMPVLREGNVIVVPEGTLFVAEACSGITSIVTLLPVAALLAFLIGSSRRQLLALLLVVIPVAMFWNLVRVLATVVATRAVGVEQATSGTLHESAGMLTFVAGCVTLLVLSSWIGTDRQDEVARET